MTEMEILIPTNYTFANDYNVQGSWVTFSHLLYYCYLHFIKLFESFSYLKFKFILVGKFRP